MYDLFLFSGGVFAAALALGQIVSGPWSIRRFVRLAFFGCFAVLLLLRWRDSDGRYENAPIYLRLYVPFVFWSVAGLYLYVRDLAANLPGGLRRRDLAHFVPGVLATVALTPFYLSDPVSKVRAYAQSGLPIWARDPGIPDFVDFCGILALLVYGLLTFQVAVRSLRGSLFTPSERSRSLLVIAVVCLCIAASAVFGISLHRVGYDIAAILFPVLLLVMFLADQRDPQFLRDPKASPRLRAERDRLGGLDETAILARVRCLMEEDRLFCDEDLNVAGLANHLNIRADQLSAVLNRGTGKNFNAFVNEYRVSAVQAMLLDAPERSILSVALACGFNSQRSFQAAFRKHTGLSARQYRRQHAGTDAQQLARA